MGFVVINFLVRCIVFIFVLFRVFSVLLLFKINFVEFLLILIIIWGWLLNFIVESIFR